ncbi:MAG: serine hydroxymethyltransferase, partial [Clostridia bacterium]|nr:serine hydroxymethyltransferase [Clostridia bacterium]
FVTSGIRVGTPAVTTRGFTKEDIVEVAKLISLTLADFENNNKEVKQRVLNLCKKHPLYE